ncbi:MAG: TonB-dependent receptor, partial [Elusimicrobiota bacterium]
MLSKKKLVSMLVGLMVSGLTQIPVAQEEEKPLELEEVVITGTKTERRLKDVPVRTEIITSKEIEDKGAANLYEALEGMPGVRVEQQCSYCNFSIVRMQGMAAGHVQVLIDGQPIYSGLAGVYGLQQIPTANIERIEIVKGAGSALYGASAIAGVINIITKKPEKEPQVEVSASFGEHNTNSYTVGASRRVKNMDVMVTAQKHTQDEIFVEDESRAQIDNGVRFSDRVRSDNNAVGARINFYDLSGGDKLTFTGRTLNEARRGGQQDEFENPFEESSEHIHTTRYETTVGYEKEFSAGNSAAINLAYCTHNRNATNDTFVGDYMATHNNEYPPSNLLRPYLADENLMVADLSYKHPLGNHNLLAGFQSSYNKLEEEGMYVELASSTPYKSSSEKHANDYGVYVQDEFKPLDKLELVLGVRYDKHSSEDSFAGSGDTMYAKKPVSLKYDEEAFNPRFAVKYEVGPSLILRTSVGTGFRVPYGFSEDLHLCSGSPRVYKPVGLEPEKSVSFNFGIDHPYKAHYISLNFFRTNLEKKIDFADAPEEIAQNGYDYQWENIGEAYTQGIEAGLRLAIYEDFDVDLNLTYTDARYKDKRDDWKEFAGGKYYDDSIYISRVPQMTGGL